MPVHTLLIDSRDRDFEAFPSPSSYKLWLPASFYDVTSARLVSAEIPRSFHTFSTAMGNTSFDMIVGGNTVAVTIPDGNYTFTSMKTTLEGALAYATGLTFTVLFSATTNRVTMFNVELTDFELACPASDAPTDWGLLYYLGFDADTTPTSSSGSITSPRPATFNNIAYILMDIEDLYGVSEGGLYGGVVGRRPFAKIPIDPGMEGYAMLDTSKCMFDDVPQRPRIPRLDSLRIKFRYHNNQEVDFNGVDHSFTIRLETIDRESEPPVIAVESPAPKVKRPVAPKPPPPQTPSPIIVVEKSRGYLKPAILAAVLAAMAWYFFARRRRAES